MATQSQTMTNQQQGPRPNTTILAHVVVDDSGSAIDYKLKPGNAKSDPYVTGHKKIDIPTGPDLYTIEFHLVDTDSQRKLAFDSAMPICAVDGTNCPTSGGISTKQLKQPDPVKAKKLTIQDYNFVAGSVCFSLFFVDENGGQPVDPFDPIISNRGGGTPPFE